MNMGDILGRNKRIDYGKSLMPDEGWRTSWAIGTTYSLDLEVLMSIPLALFQSKYLTDEIEDGVDNLRMDMLDALDKVKDRMFVFVHENNISAKCKNPKLVSFLDQNIWNFEPTEPTEPTDAFVSFHPKVWLVRYEKNTPNSNEYKYRLVVMSRNISSATDFDIAVAMDGVPDEKGNRKNNNMPLKAMMAELMQKTGRNDIVEQFEKELQNVCFKAPAPFQTQVFWPHTFGEFGEFKCPLLHENGIENYDELMVISPFVHNVTLENLAKKVADKEKRILISRENELMKCDPKVLNSWRCYAMLGNYENCDVEVGDDESDVMNVALHAKIYIVKAKWNWGKKTCYNWFVGSTNCTEAGFGKNREALLQLKSRDESTSPNKVLESLMPFLIEYQPTDSKESVQDAGAGKEMRELLFAVSRLGYQISLDKQIDDKYIVTVSVDENNRSKVVKDGVSITLSLFGHDSQKWELTESGFHTFDNVDCDMLSSFARVEIEAFGETKTFLLKLPIEMSPNLLTARHIKIMSEIIGDEERMMGYIMHCLDPFAMPGKQIKKRNQTKHGGGNQDKGLYLLPIYEKLLVAASRNPQLLDDIGRNIELLKDTRDKDGLPLLSKDFNDMWAAFMSARKNG